jgi:hypothetical protein
MDWNHLATAPVKRMVDTNPDRRMDMVHIKIILSTSDPELWVFAIEGGEIEFGEFS